MAKRPRYSAHPDANQAEIIEYVKATMPCWILDVSKFMPTPDLLVWAYDVRQDRWRWSLWEIKTETGKLTAKQRKLLAEWPGAILLARSADDILREYGRIKKQKGHPMSFVLIHDLIDPYDPQGRTYKQVNADKQHAIPIGALVEIDFGVRLFVVKHNRDCDMTPLYSLSPYCPEEDAWHARSLGNLHNHFGGYSEERLTVIDTCPDTTGWDE